MDSKSQCYSITGGRRPANQFGWDDLGAKPELAPVKLRTVEYETGLTKYFALLPEGNDALAISREGDVNNFRIGVAQLFSVNRKGKLSCNEPSAAYLGSDVVVVLDSKGNILLQQPFDKKINKSKGEMCMATLKTIWDAAPMGTVKVGDGPLKAVGFLYGFKELWQWGVENAKFPVIAQ